MASISNRFNAAYYSKNSNEPQRGAAVASFSLRIIAPSLRACPANAAPDKDKVTLPFPQRSRYLSPKGQVTFALSVR